MEGLKMSCVTAGARRDQKVDIYLDDLRDRFKELRKQHDIIIEKMFKIMHEISEASSEFCNIESKNNPKIKDLIRGFECGSGMEAGRFKRPNISIEKNVEEKKVLQNYEKLNGIDFMNESHNLFKRTKDALGKVEMHLDKLWSDKFNLKTEQPTAPTHRLKAISKYQPRNFDMKSAAAQPKFSSCFSSSASLNIFRSVEDCKQDSNEFAASDMGYQGDIDESEYDLHASKKKMGKS